MQKWEYCYIQAYKNDIETVNGYVVKREENSLPGYINKAGEEGWELVGTCPSSESGSSWRLIFKRPIE